MRLWLQESRWLRHLPVAPLKIVQDGASGFLLKPGDSVAMADKIAVFIRDPGRAKLMGVAGRKRIEEDFNAEQTARNIELIYLSSHPL